MNLSAVPQALRGWAIGINNKMQQLEDQIGQLQQTAARMRSLDQRPVAAFSAPRITVNSPTPLTEREDSAYFFPNDTGPTVRLRSVTGLVKISMNATVIVKPLSIDQYGHSGRYNVGMGFSVTQDVSQPTDYEAVRSGDYSRWAMQEIELGAMDSPATANREYKYSISATQYATIPYGEHYCRSEYYVAGIGNSAVVQFANRTLIVEPI